MRFKPVPRYSRGVVVDQDTLQPGTAGRRRRASRFVPALTAVDKASPVGMQFIQPRVATTGGTGLRLDDVLGPWWAVACGGNDPARLFDGPARERLQHLGMRTVCFISETQRPWAQEAFADTGTLVVGDLDGSLKAWFDTRAVGTVFIRPDRFVAAACLAQDAPRALASVLTALSADAATA